MGIDFRVRDFAHPISILRLKRVFDRNQWLGEEELREYQLQRLNRIIDHSWRNIPYYQELLGRHGITPEDIATLEDLKRIPFLSKAALGREESRLLARNASNYQPAWLSTSGTSGRRIRFCVDRFSNSLEFTYYWRFWGWAGYRLGDVFAELSAEFFCLREGRREDLFSYGRLSRRLILNSLLLSRARVDDFADTLRRYRPLFLKGLPSNLYVLALLFNERKNHGVRFKAVFSQGENLHAYQRELIERVFSTRVLDSYGHMERTVAISQCPFQSYHVHPDYGLVEFVLPEIPVTDSADAGTVTREVVGTSLHNLAMPLIRYRTGDLVKLPTLPRKCRCGRGFPTVSSILGRDTDVVVTADGRAVTALYTVFDRVPGVILGQIVQHQPERLDVRVACAVVDIARVSTRLEQSIRQFVGPSMQVTIQHTKPEDIRLDGLGKFKVVMSAIPPDRILG
jgi:phenylacetate-CoA ligase